MFNDDAMLKYLQVFNFLWRGKRMEYCLTSMLREQTSSARLLQPLTGETVSGEYVHKVRMLWNAIYWMQTVKPMQYMERLGFFLCVS